MEKRHWTVHVFYVCSLTGEQCGENYPYGKSLPPSCDGCDVWMEPGDP